MSKLIDLLHKLEGTSEQDITALMSWIATKTPQAVKAFTIAHTITSAFIKEATSPTGIVIEGFIGTLIPGSAPYFPAVLAAAQKLAIATQKVADDMPAVEGIALRYGAEIIAIIDGNKDTLDNYIMEFQKLYTTAKPA